MAAFALPIDFDAIRVALVQAVSVGTGVPEAQVIMLEPEGLDAPRPPSPYFGIQITSPSIKSGIDWSEAVIDAPGAPTGLFNYVGQRTMRVGFECYAKTHELAFGLMACLQAAMDQPPTQEALSSAGLSALDIGAVVDLSALLATSFEGRAQMDVSFGLFSSVTVDVGQIATVPISSKVHADGRVLTDVYTVTKEG